MSQTNAAVAEEPDAPDLVETCAIEHADITIHAEHPFGRVTYIDVTSPRGTVDTQIRAKSVDLNGGDLGGLKRALHLQDCRIELDADQTHASIRL